MELRIPRVFLLDVEELMFLELMWQKEDVILKRTFVKICLLL